MKARMTARVFAGLVASLLVSSAAFSYVLLNPPRKWFSTPRLVHVDDGGLTSVVAPDTDGGLTAALGAVTAWNTAPGGATLSVTAGTPTTTNISLGDGRSNMVFGDPIGVCSGSCIAATFTGYYNSGQTGSCDALNVVAITDSDVVFNLAYNYTTLAEDPPGSGTCSGEIYLEAVTTHEIGHLIGLGHSANGSALMAPTLSYCVNKPLHTDDTAGRDALYDCSGGGGCLSAGQSCTTGGECCSGNCKGKPGRKTCK